MKCPNCQKHVFKKITIGSVGIDQCEKCIGLWFDKDELRKVKDQKAPYEKWFDFDLWSDKNQFKVESSLRRCPKDSTEMFKIHYGNSNVVIDACKKCNGVWLDKSELTKIIGYVNTEGDRQIVEAGQESLISELKEIINGPENLISEIRDVFAVTKLLEFKFFADHFALAEVLSQLPRI